jgi:hypothetical protein
MSNKPSVALIPDDFFFAKGHSLEVIYMYKNINPE